jgi:hypothetical protein
MSKNQQGPRKPATKFANLRKKLQKQKTPVKKPTGERRKPSSGGRDAR